MASDRKDENSSLFPQISKSVVELKNVNDYNINQTVLADQKSRLSETISRSISFNLSE